MALTRITGSVVKSGSIELSDLASTIQDSITAVGSKVGYYESNTAPTVASDGVQAGDLWKDTDTNVIYMASVESSVATWFEL